MAETTETRMERLASKAADRAVRAFQSSGATFEIPDNLNFSTDDLDSDVVSDGEVAAAFDIFDWCDDTTKKGHQIQYVVKRNGEMLGIKYHPYSWEQIQKEFKGGQYQVVAKSLTTKKYLKSETRTLSDPIKGASEDFEDVQPKFIPPPQPQGPNFMELFTLFQGMSEKQRVEAREAARENAQTAQANMMAFVEMMKSSQTGSQQMFFEIAKMTQTVSEKLAESQRQMFEKMETRFEKVLEKVSEKTAVKPEKPEFTLMDILKLQNDSQEKGFALFNKLSQIAESKAAERVELIEELRGDTGGGEKKEKSMTDTLIETMLPTIATALTQRQAVAPQVAQVQPTRRMLQPPVAAIPQQARAAQPRPVAPAAQAQASRPVQAKAAQAQGQTVGGSSRVASRQTPPVKGAFGLPTATFFTEPAVQPVETPVVEEKKEVQVVETKVGATIESYKELLVPVFGDCLLNLKSVPEGSQAVLAALEKNGHTREEFLKTVSLADLMSIVASFELPAEANPWFEGVYADLKGTTGVVAG